MIQLSDHFTYKKLFRFVLPSIGMMIFTSIYGMVDGFFISNFVGKTSFAAVNLIIPCTIVFGAVGFMISSGGNAIVAKSLGEGKREQANKWFSMLIYLTILVGAVLSVLGVIFIRPLAHLLGADDTLIGDCVTYGRIMLISLVPFMLQIFFQTFFVTAEKPQLGLAFTLLSGVTNMGLDALFMAVFHFGVVGAAAATAIAQCVGGIIPLIYFARKNSSILRLVKARFESGAIMKSCFNGFSEFLSQVSGAFVSMIYNVQLLHFAGENGVAAYGAIMYVDFIFVAIFVGYSVGSAPVIGYNYGAQNHAELRNMYKKSMTIMVIVGILMLAFAQIIAKPLAVIYVGYDRELFDITIHGFRIFSWVYLICGINIFASGFFTALNNGAVSAIISFLRTIIFKVSAVLILPNFIGIDGIWVSVVLADLLAVIISLIFLITKRKKYKY